MKEPRFVHFRNAPRPWLKPVFPVLWSVLITVILVHQFHDWLFDDPYITYRYAANIAHGMGFVYNPGEYVLSTTTPLYTLLLALVGSTGISIPLASNVMACISLGAGGLLFWHLGQVLRAPTAGTIGLLLYPTFWLLLFTIGAETSLYLTLILASFVALAHGHDYGSAVLLALATLTRPDGVVAALAVGVSVLLERRDHLLQAQNLPEVLSRFWHTRIVQAALVYAAVLAPWLLFAWYSYGSPIPTTLAAKRSQGQMAISQGFFEGLMEQAASYGAIPFFHIQAALIFPGIGYALTRRPCWFLIIGWSLLYTLTYTMLGVTSYFWYYAPVVVGWVALVAVGGEALARLLRRFLSRRWRTLVLTLLIGLLLFPQIYGLFFLRTMGNERQQMYPAVGAWLREQTPPDARVAAMEVGIIGFYGQRRMIDFAGLIQPEVARHLTRKTTYEDAAWWALTRYHPDYVVLHDGAFVELERSEAFRDRCAETQVFVREARRIVVYACQWKGEKRREGTERWSGLLPHT